MPSLSFATEAAVLGGLFQGTPLPVVSTIYAALHNANPGGSGTQSTNETAYSNYARVAVPCSPGSWAVSGAGPAQVQNLQYLRFPICGAVGDVLTFWSLGYAASGPGQVITSGPIGPGAAYGCSADVAGAFFVPLLPPGLVQGQPLALYQFGPGMLLPGGFVEGQVYYLCGISGQALSLSATPASTPISPTSQGSGILVPVSPLTVAQGMVPTFPPNSMTTYLD
jgi:hypothetical protein